MLTGYGISGIGGYGLDASSMYGSYGDYATMAMLGGMSPYGNMGMMGMNPAFMGQMAQMQRYMEELQQEREKNQLRHSNEMHNLIQQAEVNQLAAHDRAIFEKAMRDGYLQEGIRTLANVIRSGDQDAICEQYNKLRASIYNEYSDYFQSPNAAHNAFPNVNHFIRTLYGQIIKAQSGAPADLEQDIKTYGESPFMHGFNRTFLGKKGHNELYSEETINQLFGTRINDKESKDRTVKWGDAAAHAAELGAVGVAGAGAATVFPWVAKMFTGVNLGTSLKAMKHWGRLGFAAAVAGDLLWQLTRD